MKWPKVLGLLLMCLLLVTVAACGGKEAVRTEQKGAAGSENTNEDSSAALKDIKVVLDWTPNTNHPVCTQRWIRVSIKLPV